MQSGLGQRPALAWSAPPSSSLSHMCRHQPEIVGSGGWEGGWLGGCHQHRGDKGREKIPRAHPQKNQKKSPPKSKKRELTHTHTHTHARPNGTNQSSPTCRDLLAEFQPDRVVTASHPLPSTLHTPLHRPPDRGAKPQPSSARCLNISSSLRLGCKPICIIDVPFRGGQL